MLPASGWLDEPQLKRPIDALLPVPYALEYWEGGLGPIEIISPQPFPLFDDLFVASFINRRVGYVINPVPLRLLRLEFVQINVFGVLLLDAFTPPNITPEIIDFNYSPWQACTTPAQIGTDASITPEATSDVTFTGCEIGSDTEYT